MAQQGRERKLSRSRRSKADRVPVKQRVASDAAWDFWRHYGSDWLFGVDASGFIVWMSLAAQTRFGAELAGNMLPTVLEMSEGASSDFLSVLANAGDKPIQWEGARKAGSHGLRAASVKLLILPAKGMKSRASHIVLVQQQAAPGTETAGAIIAHEITQPLTATLTHLQAFRRLTKGKRIGNKDAGQAIDGALRAAERAAETVERMREWSRGHALPRTAEDAQALLRQSVELLEPEWTAQQVNVSWEVEDSLPPVWVNAGAVVQVATNLIRNALEAMQGLPPDRQRLVLVARSTDGLVEVGIRDAGRGVSIAMVQRLFEPFQSTKSSGTGLGLALSRSLIETMGGSMWARPNPEHGYTFYFTLPKAPVQP